MRMDSKPCPGENFKVICPKIFAFLLQDNSFKTPKYPGVACFKSKVMFTEFIRFGKFLLFTFLFALQLQVNRKGGEM